MKKLIIFFVAGFVGSFALCAAAANDSILGDWYTGETKESIVTMYKCADKICGKISWLKYPKRDDGSEKFDDKNSDESLRTRKIIGMDIVADFVPVGDNKWSKGTIYDPNNGKTYSCKITLNGNKLDVRGYIGISLFGRTTVWHRKD